MPTANRTFGIVETVYRLSGLWVVYLTLRARGRRGMWTTPARGDGEVVLGRAIGMVCGGARFGLGGKNVLLSFARRSAMLFLGFGMRIVGEKMRDREGAWLFGSFGRLVSVATMARIQQTVHKLPEMGEREGWWWR